MVVVIVEGIFLRLDLLIESAVVNNVVGRAKCSITQRARKLTTAVVVLGSPSGLCNIVNWSLTFDF